MRNKDEGIRSHPPAWVHYMCFACWSVLPGNEPKASDGDTLGVFIPEGRFKVGGRAIYRCCICKAFNRDLTWFAPDPSEQPSCQHDVETKAVRRYRTLYHSRPNPGLENVPGGA